MKNQVGELSDQALVKAYVNGDSGAFAAIVHRHQAMMNLVAARYARNEYDAQDIVQEALLRAARMMHTYRSEAQLATWLHRLVLNAGYDHMWKGENARRHASIHDDRVRMDTNRALSHDPLGNLDRLLAMRHAIETLPAAQRRALLLIDVVGLTVDKAAREMGVPTGTVKSRRNRARKTVAMMLADSNE